jgi:hypothetical protein
MRKSKFTTIALASAFVLSSTFALASTVHHKPSVRTYDLHRDMPQVRSRVLQRATAIPTVQPAYPPEDTCRTEGAPPSGVAASSGWRCLCRSLFERSRLLLSPRIGAVRLGATKGSDPILASNAFAAGGTLERG